ncbi:MAG: hypothetical protein AYK22_05190 [Thermoplasmatales archaeon SG8-52-3]|nr:MAG: hypothetical protein AYK22_05190 [Thermoplasmatales archaeon SG8-52-3]
MSQEAKNPWTTSDERPHDLSMQEWWCLESFFKTIKDKKKWCIRAYFWECEKKSKKTLSIFDFSLFDLTKGNNIIYNTRRSELLEKAKDRFDIRYEDSFIQGEYPNYKMIFNDKKNDILLKVDSHADSLPHWIANEATNGWLPMGLGVFRYGFIPKNKITGTLHINNKVYKLRGHGYFEHVWGDFLYKNPLGTIFSFKKTFSTYINLIKWWHKNNKIKLPNSIVFSSENNPLSNDWAWAIFENGWTIFYGNILFWIMEGPATGILILSKDGRNYIEFGKIWFKYNKIRHSKEFDCVYPSDIEIIAQNKKEKLHLNFKMTTKSRELIERFPKNRHWIGLTVNETPGKIDGYYYNDKEKIKLKGYCKIEPHRQISRFGHNRLKVDFIYPPKGMGINSELISNYLKKKINMSIRLDKFPPIKFQIQKNV